MIFMSVLTASSFSGFLDITGLQQELLAAEAELDASKKELELLKEYQVGKNLKPKILA